MRTPCILWMYFLCVKMFHKCLYTGGFRLSYIMNSHPLIRLSFSKFGLSYTAHEKHFELQHSGTARAKPTLQTLRDLGKNSDVCLYSSVCSYCFVPARNCFKHYHMTPTCSCSTNVSHLSFHALYIYLMSRSVKLSPVLFYVFSMPGKLHETTRIVCKK